MFKVRWVFTGITADRESIEAVTEYINKKVKGEATIKMDENNGVAFFARQKIADITKCLEK